MTIEEIAKTFPNVSLTIQASDLIAFGERLVSETLAKAKEEGTKHDDPLLTEEEVRNLFGVSSTTLWRWRKRGYLEGVPVGGRIKYRSSDCQRILKMEKNG